ncbi:hypothetical protein HPP92_015424 [Vanilla planifolia]|uniref:Uncharacterized protein n=1 Tax=Vanilla planifolia TaxID=51239 RepID=A0A835UWB3_VANPL|nr:hypothetical protein HPP92_016003 [Vanilla planifolia]KAG0475738.1 hypothetical protein HPP92_015424 [Vanilla planifolia]
MESITNPSGGGDRLALIRRNGADAGEKKVVGMHGFELQGLLHAASKMRVPESYERQLESQLRRRWRCRKPPTETFQKRVEKSLNGQAEDECTLRERFVVGAVSTE